MASKSPDQMEDYTLRERMLTLYMETGSVRSVATQLGVDYTTVLHAMKSDWWVEEFEARRRTQIALETAKLTQLLGYSLEELEDRIVNGDETIDSLGGIHRVRISGANLARIIAVVFDKRQLLNDLPTNITKEASKINSIANRLELLGQALQKQAQLVDITDKGTVTDVRDNTDSSST